MTRYGDAVVERPHVGHARDVLALDARRGARLAEEARDRVRLLVGVRFAHELERDALLEVQVGRDDDPAHAAFAEQALDAVLAGEHRPGRKRHRGRGDAVGLAAHWQVSTPPPSGSTVASQLPLQHGNAEQS